MFLFASNSNYEYRLVGLTLFLGESFLHGFRKDSLVDLVLWSGSHIDWLVWPSLERVSETAQVCKGCMLKYFDRE